MLTSFEEDDLARSIDGLTHEGRVKSAIEAAISVAITDSEGERKLRRIKAMEAYRGDFYGDEAVGRSNVVMTDFRDTVKTIMPSLLRVFFGSERAMEYTPRTADDIPLAEQATDFINDVVLNMDNEGFLLFKGWFTDALTQWLGVMKVWWEETTCWRTRRYSLKVDPTLSQKEQAAADLIFLAKTYPDLTTMPEHEREGDTLIVTEKYTEGKARFDILPPESFLYSPQTRTPENTPFMGDRTFKTKSQLVDLGIDADYLPETLFTSDQPSLPFLQEDIVRNPNRNQFAPEFELPQSKTTQYIEGYMRLPVDDSPDARVQWHKVCVAGESYDLVADIEPVDWHPYCILSPDPQPHRLEGYCVADDTMDIQRIRTLITRATLDSLAEAVVPRRAIVEGQVRMEDVLTQKRGHPIRELAPGMIRNLDTQFVGPASLPVLDYFDKIREERTGITKAASGLNADALQSSTKTAVDATVNAAQQQLELIARIFMETGVKTLFRKLLRLVCERQTSERVVRLRNKQFVSVDTAQWDANMDVGVSVALGAGLAETRIAALNLIAAKQEQILQLLGPSNPLVTLGQYQTTLSKIVELSGFQDAAAFFTPVPPDWQPPQPASPPPDPAMMLAQVEREKTQAKTQQDHEKLLFDMQMDRERMQFDRETAMRKDQTQREIAEAQLVVQVKEIELKYNAQINEAQLDAQITQRLHAMTLDAQPEPSNAR